jgi:hypothetical protein
MTYTVTKKGHADWADLAGKRITFDWSDGWDDFYPDMIFSHTQPYDDDDDRYPRYYVLEENGGGYSFWESYEVKVTVHD